MQKGTTLCAFGATPKKELRPMGHIGGSTMKRGRVSLCVPYLLKRQPPSSSSSSLLSPCFLVAPLKFFPRGMHCESLGPRPIVRHYDDFYCKKKKIRGEELEEGL